MTSINQPLIEAAISGDAEFIKHNLGKAACDPLHRDSAGRSALMHAVRYGFDACVSLLLPKSDPLAKDRYGDTALMWACCRGHEDCVRLLLPVSDTSAQNKEGFSAEEIATRCGHTDLAAMIGVYLLARLKESSLMIMFHQYQVLKRPGNACVRDFHDSAYIKRFHR